MKLGKLPARVNATQLKLGAYLDADLLQRIPAEFGHERALADYPILGHDEAEMSVWAGAAYETILWAAEAGQCVEFNTTAVISDYSAFAGYDPSQPETDRGTDLQGAASYRRRIGIVDSFGQRHRVGAYVALTPGDPDELAAAAYIFGAVGVGLRLPEHALDDFSAGKPWDVQYGLPPLAGGHYTPVVARRDGRFCVVTWGRVHEMTAMFYRRYCDEALVYFTPEILTSRSLPGFDVARLLTDLNAFTRR